MTQIYLLKSKKNFGTIVFGYNPRLGYTGNLGYMLGVNSVGIDRSDPDFFSDDSNSYSEDQYISFDKLSGVQPSSKLYS